MQRSKVEKGFPSDIADWLRLAVGYGERAMPCAAHTVKVRRIIL